MCTVSWSRDHQGYALFFYRDELNSSAPEQSPAPAWLEDTANLAPRDGDQGGTGLPVNEFGLTVCLLNAYGNLWRPAETSPRFSSGHVVLACAATDSLAKIVP